jgi:hypothetical protein
VTNILDLPKVQKEEIREDMEVIENVTVLQIIQVLDTKTITITITIHNILSRK